MTGVIRLEKKYTWREKILDKNKCKEAGGLPFVSVIISTYNRAQYIKITIDSFLNQSYPSHLYEIIICDNNSSDNTKEVIESCIKDKNEKRIRYLFEKRQGMHFARNYAAKKSCGDLLYFADDDIIADRNLLIELVSVFEDKRVGCASGKILPKWECTPPDWVKKYCINSLLSLNDLGDSTIIRRKDPGVWGCHEAVRRDVFFEVGGFHLDLVGNGPGIGDGETGMNDDIKNLGYYFAYVGKSVTYHMIPPGRMTQKYLNKRYKYNGNSHSYSEYRKKPFTKRELPKRIYYYLRTLILAEIKIVRQWRRGKMSLRFLLAEFYYYTARIRYELHIVLNKKFRALVEYSDWL